MTKFQRSIGWQHWVCLSAILLLALGVRCCNLSRNSLWTDEYLSLECSSGWSRSDLSLAGQAVAAPDLITLRNARPMTSIWSSIGTDENHPPVYFILLRIWRDLFGDSPAALRSLSVLASLTAIVLLFFLGLELHSPRAGLWACLLMALASPQIQQAQDARAYMPVTAACLAAALALLRIDRRGPSSLRCAALFCAALIAPLMHYMAFTSLAAMLIYALFLMRGPSRKWALISFASCLAVFALLWGPQMVQQHYRMIDDTIWLTDAGAGHARSIFQNLCGMPARLFLDLDLIRSPFAWLSVAAFVFPLPLCRRYPQVWLCWIWLIVPVAIGLIIDFSSDRRMLSMIRYTLVAGPGMYLLLGLLASQVRRLGWIPAAIVAGSCAICIPNSYESRIPDYRELSRFIVRSSQPGDPVFFIASRPDPYSSEGLLSVTYYLASQHHPIYVLDRKPTATLLARFKDARHICIISDGARALHSVVVPGLKLDRVEMLAGIALVGVADPSSQAPQLARQKFKTDPALKLALGMR